MLLYFLAIKSAMIMHAGGKPKNFTCLEKEIMVELKGEI